MILPPTVLGYYLILLVGRRGVIGPWLAECGINLIFSWQGAVVAATVVVFPLIYKSARAALELVEKQLFPRAQQFAEWTIAYLTGDSGPERIYELRAYRTLQSRMERNRAMRADPQYRQILEELGSRLRETDSVIWETQSMSPLH